PEEEARAAAFREDRRRFCEALLGALAAARRRAPAMVRRALRRGEGGGYADMGALLQALRRARRPAWAVHAAWLAAAAIVVAGLALQQWRSLRCGGAERHLAGLWDEGQAAA